MKKHDFPFHTVEFDETTGQYSIRRKDCQHDLILVKTKIRDGRIQVRKQCKQCRETIGAIISQKGLDLSKLPSRMAPMDEDARQQEREDLNKRLREWSRIAWLDANNPYYKSERWKEKWNLVMIRDKKTCQGCMIKPAKQVHHKTYTHFENEPLFDLVALCNPCHDAITAMSRNQPSKKIQH